MSPEKLAASWRDEARMLRKRGAEVLAQAAESYAADLEAWWREWQWEALTLEEGAEESGYSYSALQKMVGAGELPNAGKKGSPRIRRCDLPRKGARREGEPDLADAILRAS